MSKTQKNQNGRRSPIHTADGRINPDKAIALVTKILESKTPEEVRKIINTPVVLKGSDGKPLKEPKED